MFLYSIFVTISLSTQPQSTFFHFYILLNFSEKMKNWIKVCKIESKSTKSDGWRMTRKNVVNHIQILREQSNNVFSNKVFGGKKSQFITKDLNYLCCDRLPKSPKHLDSLHLWRHSGLPWYYVFIFLVLCTCTYLLFFL